jgi:hypothetical protein
MTLVNHDPGPSTTTSDSRTASTAAAQAGAPGGRQANTAHPAGRGGDRGLTPNPPSARRIVWVEAIDLGDQVKWDRAHRQHAADGADEISDARQRRQRILESVHQAADEQVADRMAGESAMTAEAVLQHAGPHRIIPVLAGQGGQGHSQVTRRQQAQFAADPAGRPAVVGDGDDSGEVGCQLTQRRQRRVQPMSATEGDRAQAARH